MSIRITHVRLSNNGSGHEHISNLRWVNDTTNASGGNTRAAIVEWIEDKNGAAHTGTGSNSAVVAVVTPEVGAKYLRTRADGKWTDNLLSLPRF